MSIHFGPLFQNGFAVHDWRAAAEHWVEVMGVGPFFPLEHIEFEWCEFRGEPVELDLSVALAFSGNQQIGITPLILLFVIGLVLLRWVREHGDPVPPPAEMTPA